MLKAAVVSEQSLKLARDGIYTFEVATSTTKEQVAKLVAEKFGVKVVSVHTVTTPGKTKMQKTRKGFYTTPDKKKAVVAVAKGQKIALFERIMNPEKAEDIETTVKEKKSLLKGTKVKIERGTKTKEEGK